MSTQVRLGKVSLGKVSKDKVKYAKKEEKNDKDKPIADETSNELRARLRELGIEVNEYRH